MKHMLPANLALILTLLAPPPALADHVGMDMGTSPDYSASNKGDQRIRYSCKDVTLDDTSDHATLKATCLTDAGAENDTTLNLANYVECGSPNMGRLAWGSGGDWVDANTPSPANPANSRTYTLVADCDSDTTDSVEDWQTLNLGVRIYNDNGVLSYSSTNRDP